MYLDKVFHDLRKKGKINKTTIYSYGLDDEFIKEMIDNNIFVAISDDEYIIGNNEELFMYGRYQLELKNYNTANSIFVCCYKKNPNYFPVNYQLFYRSLIQKNKDNIFKHFNVVFRSLNNDNRSYDANYLLYLLGNLYDLPSKYKEKFDNLKEEDILIKKDDGFSVYENMFRKEIFNNSYFKVNEMFDERFAYTKREDMTLDDCIEKELLLKWLFKNRNFNKMIVSYLSEDRIKEVKSLLDAEKEKRFLTKTNEYLLKLINSYFKIEKTGIVPSIKYDGDNVFEAIDGDNYQLALELVCRHQEAFNLERESLLYSILKKINSLILNVKNRDTSNIDPLIETLKEVREKDDKIKPLIEAVEEVRNRNKYTLTNKDIQDLDSKVDKLHNGRSVFLLENISIEKQEAIHEYIKGIKDISSHNISDDSIVLRYKPYIDEYINVSDLSKQANRFYSSSKYEEAAKCYELLLKIGKPRDTAYGRYGLTLLKLHRKEEALECLKIATIVSKERGGKLDYSDIIYDLENVKDKEDKKPKVVVKADEFVSNKVVENEDFVNDIIGLISTGEVSLIDAIKKLNLSLEDANYIKLLYARDCYYMGNISEGDIYLKQVEKSKNKDNRVKTLYKEILRDKKYYQHRLDEEKQQLVLIKNRRK